MRRGLAAWRPPRRWRPHWINPLSPMGADGRRIRRRVFGTSEQTELDSAGRVRLPKHLIRHAGLDGPSLVVGVGDHLEIWNTEAWGSESEEFEAQAAELTERLAAQGPTRRRPSGDDAPEMGTLTYMPTEHVPVLAAELIRFSAPGAGRDRRRRDLRRRRPRPSARRAGRPVGHPDLHRPRSRRGRALRGSSPRRWPARPASSPSASTWRSRELLAEGVGADLVYFDLGVSSMQIDAWERGFSYSFDAPLDMRMDTRAELTAARIVNEWPERRLAEVIRSYGDERRARSIAARDRRAPAAGADLRAGRGGPRRAAAGGPLRARQPGQAHLPGDPDRGQRRARGARRGAARRPGSCSCPAAGWRRSPSTRTRTAGSSASSPSAPAAASARPSFRSVAAVTSPRRELLTKGGIAPSAGEAGRQPALEPPRTCASPASSTPSSGASQEEEADGSTGDQRPGQDLAAGPRRKRSAAATGARARGCIPLRKRPGAAQPRARGRRAAAKATTGARRRSPGSPPRAAWR